MLPQVCCRINCEVGVLDPSSRGRLVSNGRAFRSKATRARNTFLTSSRIASLPRKTGSGTGRAKKAFNEPFDSFGSIALVAENLEREREREREERKRNVYIISRKLE